LRNNIKEKILNEIIKQIQEDKNVKQQIEEVKERLQKAYKEYNNGIPRVSEEFAKNHNITKDQLDAIICYEYFGEHSKDLPSMEKEQYTHIVKRWEHDINSLALKIEKKYDVEIYHEEGIISVMALAGELFYIEYCDNIIEMDFILRKALEKAVDRIIQIIKEAQVIV